MKKNKVISVIVRLVLICAFFTCLIIIARGKFGKYNLVILSIDTLRKDHLGVYGYGKNTTPIIDAWAKKAIVFSNVRSVAPLTYPSFVALLTGKDQLATGVIDNNSKPLNESIPTLAEQFYANGYRTAAFVSNRFLYNDLTGLSRGFESYDVDELDDTKKKKYYALIDRSIEWLKSNKDNQFFMWLHLMDPHAPYHPSTKTVCQTSKKLCGVASDIYIDNLIKDEVKWEGCTSPDEQTNRKIEEMYDGEIAEADILFGKVISTLKKLGISDNTVVILYADHGEGFDHNYYYKHSDMLYDSHINIPFMVRYPGIKAKHTDRLIQNTDIYNTLLDLFRLGKSKNNPSYSFVDEFMPALANVPRRTWGISTNFDLTKFASYDGKYKYILTKPTSGCIYNGQYEELYDYLSDPYETLNLVGQKQEIAEELRRRLEQSEIMNAEKAHIKLPRSIENEELIDKLKSLGYQ